MPRQRIPGDRGGVGVGSERTSEGSELDVAVTQQAAQGGGVFGGHLLEGVAGCAGSPGDVVGEGVGEVSERHQSITAGMGGSISAGLTVIIRGDAADEDRLTRILGADPGIGVIRHADAGYHSSIDALGELGLVAPMINREG